MGLDISNIVLTHGGLGRSLVLRFKDASLPEVDLSTQNYKTKMLPDFLH